MKVFNIFLLFLLGVFSCIAQQEIETTAMQPPVEGTYYGAKFQVDESKSKQEIWQHYNTMALTDTLSVQFRTTVREVCKVKGCWMIVELPDGEQAMVRFKDYGFFMPSDIPEKQVVLNGLAFVEEMSISDQKHYATDGGKSVDEIAKITSPKRTYSFEASGVLVPN